MELHAGSTEQGAMNRNCYWLTKPKRTVNICNGVIIITIPPCAALSLSLARLVLNLITVSDT